jgi:hypothetical protein
VFWDIAFYTAEDRLYGLAVTPLIVRDKVFPIPVLFRGNNFWEFINFELLILWRMGIIKSPLLERDESTDKVNKPADLFMLVLN